MGFELNGSHEVYVGKIVKVVCTDGDEVIGTVIGFTSAADSDDGAATVDLVKDDFYGIIVVPENEIISIERWN